MVITAQTWNGIYSNKDYCERITQLQEIDESDKNTNCTAQVNYLMSWLKIKRFKYMRVVFKLFFKFIKFIH